MPAQEIVRRSVTKSSGVQLFTGAGSLHRTMEAGNNTQSPTKALGAVVRTMLKLLMAVAGLVSVLAFGWWLYCQNQNEVGRAEWARVRAELEAKGEKLDWADFAPEPVPDEENFMRTPFMDAVAYKYSMDAVRFRRLSSRDAGFLTTHLRSPDDARSVDMVAMGNELRASVPPGTAWASTNAAAMIIEWLQPLETDFDELRAGAKLPHSQLRFASTNAMLPYQPGYVAIRYIAQQMAVLATAQLADGQSQPALDNLRVNLALAAGLEDDGNFVGFMIATTIDGLTLGVVANGLRDRRWSDLQLTELDRLLARIDLLAKLPRAIRAERAAANQYFAEWVPTVVFSPAPTGMLSAWEGRLQKYRPEGWLLSARAIVNEVFQEEFIPLYDVENRLVRKPAAERMYQRLEKLAASRHPRDRFAATVMPNLYRALETVTRHQTWVNQGRLAIALERFRMRNSRMPDSLAELPPEFMDALPHDLVSGQPLQYRRLTDDHYLLWSVGWNEVDESGVVGNGRFEGDWVWSGF
jgi:hypothetical protein